MKNIILISCWVFMATLVAAEKNPSNLFEALKNRIDLNDNGKSNQKDYLLFLDTEGNDIESSLSTFGSEWLEENIEDLVPLRDELRTILGEYNELPSPNMNNEKVQHYIMVVDVAPALFTRFTADNTPYPHYLGKEPVKYFNMSLTEDVTYNSWLEDAKMEAIENFKATFDESQLTIADQNANLYVTIFVLDRKIEFGKIKELIFTYDDVYKETSSSNFIDIINTELKPEVDKIPKIGFSFLNQFVQQFIKIFHGSTPYISTNCADVESMGFESGLGEDFYSFYCSSEEFDIEEVNFKDIVYRSAKYLDYLHVYYNIATNNNQAMIDYLGADFLTNWDDMLRDFVEGYYNSGMDQKFAIYFKSNYKDMFNTYNNDPDYKLVKFDLLFVEIFFEVDDLIGEEQYSSVLLDFTAMNNGDPTQWVSQGDQLKPYYEYNTPAGAERVTNRLYKIVTQAYDVSGSQLFTDTDRDNIYNLIIGNAQLLWDFYLNPSATGLPGSGLTVTSLAEVLGEYLNNYENPVITVDPLDWENSVPEDMPIVLTGLTRNFTNSTNGPKSDQDFNLVNALSAEYIAGGELEFTIKVADKYEFVEDCLEYNSAPTCIKYGYNWKAVYSPTQYDFSLKGDAAVGFFAPVANLNVLAPTYYENCTNCKPKITFEYAFVTASRIRDEALDDAIQKSILAIEVATLPFAFWEVVAAKGAWLVFRGIILAVNLETVAISLVGGGDFAEGCNKVFGPILGPIILPYLDNLNKVVAVVEVSELIGQGGIALVKAFGKPQLESAAAAARYASKSKEYLESSLNIPSTAQYDELKTLRSQIETNLGINGADDAGGLIDNLHDEFLGFEASGGPSTLRSNEKFEELVIKYQYWKKDFDPGTQGGDELMHSKDFLEGLSIDERNVLDAMLADELGDLIIDSFEAFDVVKNSHKMKALQKLAKNNVCQL